MSYPKWKYKGSEGCIVQTPDEEKALGKGWTDAPGETEPATEPATEKPHAHIDDDAKVPVKKK